MDTHNFRSICVKRIMSIEKFNSMNTSIELKKMRNATKYQLHPYLKTDIFSMTKHDKLLKRFLSKPKDFTYKEMIKLLNGLGYKEVKTGKSTGSRVAFINTLNHHIIRLHKPHPRNVLKKYQLDMIEEELKSLEMIK